MSSRPEDSHLAIGFEVCHREKAMEIQWYYSNQGKQLGPVPTERLKQLAASGQLQPSDMVWKEGMAQWAEASHVKGLFPAVQAPPAAAPPPESQAPAPPWAAWNGSGNGPTVNPAPVVNTSPSPVQSKFRALRKTPTSWLALFDWRFEYYLTPWIIRFFWIAFLAITVLVLLFNTLGLAWGLMPDVASTPAKSNFGGGFHEPSGPALPGWLTLRFAKVVLYVISVIGSIFGVLITRVILEMMIVVFRIAEDIGLLKRKYADECKE